MAEDDGIEKDRLYLAITRPTTMKGVPFEGMVLNIAISWFAYFGVGHANPISVRGTLSMIVFPILHYAMRLAMSIDHNLFRILRLYAETHRFQPRGTAVRWAINPWPPKKARDLPSSFPYV